MGSEIRTVGVVGAGTMGIGIAQLAIEAGHDVRIHDPDPSALAAAEGRIRDGLARRAARSDLDADAIDDWVEGRASGLRAVIGIDGLARDADLVIEAAVEDLDVKRSIFAALDHVAPPHAVLATNTSALSIEAIAEATARPARVAGLHFFNPAPLMRLVEVVGALATDPTVVGGLIVLMERWGRIPVRSADTPGFIVNRINRPFTLEPLAALEAGATTVEAVDRAIREAGYPMGPFELLDLIGIDVNLAVSRAIHAAARAAGDPLAERFRPSALQARLVEAGRLGRKSGHGFYRYGPDGRPTVATSDHEATRDDADGVDPVAATVPDRVALATMDEAYRVLGDRVATRTDIDLAMRLGAGHPVGPFERAAAMGGPAAVLVRLRALDDGGPRFVPAGALVDDAAR